MAKKRILLEIGQGTSLRKDDYTRAAERAVKNALWQNSLNVAQAFGFDKNEMIVDVTIAVQKPEKIDRNFVKEIFPYGRVSIDTTFGGLDIPKTETTGKTIIATAVLVISLDMEVVG